MRRVFLLCLPLVLSACAGPRWQTVYQYEPPVGSQAQSCAQRCAENQQSCRASCEEGYQQCLRTAEMGARDSHEAKREHYELQLQLWQVQQVMYEADWRRYEHQRRHIEQDKREHERRCKDSPQDRGACEAAERARRDLRHLSSHRPYAPTRPYVPSLSDEIAEAQSRCSRDCGCIETYNACYGACGGRVIPHRRCVENCPDDVPQYQPERP
ncbi:MAG: hypothetical protein ACOZAQ_02495 [Pseudomonadota bacterium]